MSRGQVKCASIWICYNRSKLAGLQEDIWVADLKSVADYAIALTLLYLSYREREREREGPDS